MKEIKRGFFLTLFLAVCVVTGFSDELILIWHQDPGTTLKAMAGLFSVVWFILMILDLALVRLGGWTLLMHPPMKEGAATIVPRKPDPNAGGRTSTGFLKLVEVGANRVS